MNHQFAVVDLFAGPGGLAEGFSRVENEEGRAFFDVMLSVEKEASAFKTLRLRSFFRQFGKSVPSEYYGYVAGEVTLERLIECHPRQWANAIAETMQLELGTEGSQAALDPLLKKIRDQNQGKTILIGGPPCQAYSLVGRARNRGNADYDAAKDHRHFLYREYIRIIQELKPEAFVMENVKGMLSAKVGKQEIFELVKRDLKDAGSGEDSYVLLPLVLGRAGQNAGYVVRCEDYGIPQQRHRVILLGLKADRAERALENLTLAECSLEPVAVHSTVSDALLSMPRLRSGLSKDEDSNANWKKVALESYVMARNACQEYGNGLSEVAKLLQKTFDFVSETTEALNRTSNALAPIQNNALANWIVDAKMSVLPNHETRGHMSKDLARYAFAAAFAEKFKRSPMASEYPEALAPKHLNWKTGNFADRFRVQRWDAPSSTITSHISKDGHYFIHPDATQCRSLTVREAARLQTFPDNYLFEGNRTQQYVQVGNAVPPLMAYQIALILKRLLET